MLLASVDSSVRCACMCKVLPAVTPLQRMVQHRSRARWQVQATIFLLHVHCAAADLAELCPVCMVLKSQTNVGELYVRMRFVHAAAQCND